MLDALPQPLLECTIRGSVLILIAIAATPVVRRSIGRNGVQWLWAVALVALLCPITPGTPFSLQNAWESEAPEIVLQNEPRLNIPPPTVRVAPAPDLKEPTAFRVVTSSSIAIGEPKPTVQLSMSEWVLSIWAVGTVLLLCQLGWRWRQTMRLVRNAREVTDARWEQLLLRVGVKRRIRLAVTSQLRAPALAGVLQPRVLIPETWLTELNDSDLEAVLLHELGHYRRGDLIWEWMFAMARCVHWFNPLVWFAERLARHERELGCDSWALERAGSPARYGYALVAALQRVSSSTRGGFGVVAMAESASQIERRLRWIAQHRSQSSWPARFAAIPALIALLAFGTRPLPARGHVPTPDALPPAEIKSPPLTARPESVEVRTRLIRVPEKTVLAMGLPVASDGSAGINRIYTPQDFVQLMATLRGTQDVEFLSTPRLLSKEGSRTSFDVTREFPYPESYEKQAEDLFVPVNIVQGWVGLRMESEAVFVPPKALRLRVVAKLRRLSGFADKSGKLTPVLIPEQANWLERLTSWQMPAGAEGNPEFVAQNASTNFESFVPGEGALIFGFRDTGAEDNSMVNYIALEVALR